MEVVMENLTSLWEAILFLSDHPVTAADLAESLGIPEGELIAAAQELVASSDGDSRGVVVREVAGGYQMVTSPAVSGEVARYFKRVRRMKLSRAALETLALIAYRQPVTRGEIEQIRGVDSSGVVGTLLDTGMAAIVGRREVPGKPLIYGTTPSFLERFGLRSLGDMPTMEELNQLLADAAGPIVGEGEGIAGEDADVPEAPESVTAESAEGGITAAADLPGSGKSEAADSDGVENPPVPGGEEGFDDGSSEKG
jgi:segregation and condensation protein B